MEATFYLNNGYTLVLGNEGVGRLGNCFSGPGVIGIAVVRHDIAPPFSPAEVQPRERKPDELVMTAHLEPSHLRAIASALMTAAQNARR